MPMAVARSSSDGVVIIMYFRFYGNIPRFISSAVQYLRLTFPVALLDVMFCAWDIIYMKVNKIFLLVKEIKCQRKFAMWRYCTSWSSDSCSVWLSLSECGIGGEACYLWLLFHVICEKNNCIQLLLSKLHVCASIFIRFTAIVRSSYVNPAHCCFFQHDFWL